MQTRSSIRFALNGQIHEVSGADAFLMLADYLRKSCQLTGTKIVCAEGDCGACTVLKAFSLKATRDELVFEPINACIALLAQMDGAHLVTVEGLAEPHAGHPVQEAMVKAHASQCGYCTPGIVMALTGCISQCSQALDAQKAKNALTGNLCRCTGYTPIIEAALALDPQQCPSLLEKFHVLELQKQLRKTQKAECRIEAEGVSLWAPTDLDQLLRLRKKHPDALLLSSTTDLGVQINKGKRELSKAISLHLVPELYQWKKQRQRLLIGARVSLETLRQLSRETIPELSRLLDVFASPQIKNTATLVGNIANASPIGDTLPFLLAVDASVIVASVRGEREVPLSELFVGYRRLQLKADELITKVHIPIPSAQEYLRLYKAATRKDLDIATVSAAFLWSLDPKKVLLQKVHIALGGVAATPIRAHKTEAFLKGRRLTREVLGEASTLLQEEIQPLSDLRGSSAYRRLLLQNFWEQFTREFFLAQEVQHERASL